ARAEPEGVRGVVNPGVAPLLEVRCGGVPSVRRSHPTARPAGCGYGPFRNAHPSAILASGFARCSVARDASCGSLPHNFLQGLYPQPARATAATLGSASSESVGRATALSVPFDRIAGSARA